MTMQKAVEWQELVWAWIRDLSNTLTLNVYEVNPITRDMIAKVMGSNASFWEKLDMPFGRELFLEYQTDGEREWWALKSKPEDDRPVPPFTIRMRDRAYSQG